MQLFYFPDLHEGMTSAQLEGEDVHHITKVLRKQSGDVLHLTNGKGCHFMAEISDVRKQRIQVEIRKVHLMPEPYFRGITLAMGVVKQRERLEFAIEKAVEIGVGRIVLFHADRSERSRVNVSRLENIMISAMKQSMQVYLPELVEVGGVEDIYSSEVAKVRSNDEVNLAEVDKAGSTDMGVKVERVAKDHPPESGSRRVLVAHEQVTSGDNPMKFGSGEQVILVVGPEGGLTEREIGVFAGHGADMISLGTTRQRAETAAISMLTVAHLGYPVVLRQGGIPLYSITSA